MQSRSFDAETTRDIAQGGKLCEHALKLAAHADDEGFRESAEDWRARAAWWSDEAFRLVAA